MPLDGKYIKAIWACANQHGLSRDEVHDVTGVWGKTSVKDLTKAEALKLLDGIRGPKGGKRRRDAAASHGRRDYDAKADPRYLVAEREIKMIERLANLRRWTSETLEDFTRRQIGKPKPRTLAEANKVIWALKAMNRRDNLMAS